METLSYCQLMERCLAAEARVEELAAENVLLKQIFDSVTDLSNEPQYHAEGMGCGLEDRGITDRYEACHHGWDEAIERVYGEVIPRADELNFPATDRIVAGIKADGVEMVLELISHTKGMLYADSVKETLSEVSSRLREGAK